MKKQRIRATLAGLAAGILICTVGFVQPSGAAVYASDRWGAYGSPVVIEPNLCDRGSMGAFVQDATRIISRAQAYPNSTQTVNRLPRVERWNGSAWVVHQYGSWQTSYAAPGQNAGFSKQDFSVPRGQFYRVVDSYRWYVGNTQIGGTSLLFTESEYGVWGGSVGQTGNSPSYCYITN